MVLFSPLAQVYSKQLIQQLFSSKGLLPVKKGDLFSLFWAAWVFSFTEANILKAFKATGVHPFNPNFILEKFAPPNSDNSDSLASSASYYSSSEWRRIDRSLLHAVKDKTSKDVLVLRHTLHHICISHQLLQHKNEGLVDALTYKNKQNKKSKTLNLQQHEESPWAPSHFSLP